jgi:hypothetical protein
MALINLNIDGGPAIKKSFAKRIAYNTGFDAFHDTYFTVIIPAASHGIAIKKYISLLLL